MDSLSRASNPASGKRRRHRFDPGCETAGRFAECQPVQIVEVEDLPLGIEHDRDQAKPAKHPVFTEAGLQQVHVAHAVEHGEDQGIRPAGRRQRLHRRFQVVGLATEQDEIERALDIPGHHRRRGREVEIAELAPDHQTGLRQLGRAPLPDQECHVPAGAQQPAAVVTADAAGSDHENPHVSLTQ